jgi:hypothetical protein
LVDEPRDWNAILERVLAPFRSEAAAFRVLIGVAIVCGTIMAIVLLARAIF